MFLFLWILGIFFANSYVSGFSSKITHIAQSAPAHRPGVGGFTSRCGQMCATHTPGPGPPNQPWFWERLWGKGHPSPSSLSPANTDQQQKAAPVFAMRGGLRPYVEQFRRPWTSALYDQLRRKVRSRQRNLKDDLRSNIAVVGTILNYLWPKASDPLLSRTRLMLFLSLICLYTGKLVSVRVPFLMQKAIDSMATPAQGAAALVPISLFVMYGLGRTMAVLLSEAKNLLFAYVSQAAQREYALRIFQHLHQLDSTFHHGHPTGMLSVAYVRGIRGFQAILFQMVFTVFPTLLEVGMVSAIFARRCGVLYLLATLTMFVTYCWFTVAVTEHRVKLRRDLVAVDNERTAFFVDSFANHEVVKLFKNEHLELNRFDGYLGRILDTSILNTWSVAGLNLGQTFIFSTGLTCIMLLAACKVVSGAMSIGQLVAINGLMMQLAVPFNYIGFTYQELRQGFVDMEVLCRLLNQKPSVKDTGQDTLGLVKQTYNEDMQPQFGQIVFDQVSFKYPNTTNYILNNISFTIPPAQNYAIVGPSGCGKSTILKLLARLFEIDSGRILIDGKDIRDISLSSLREHIGVVPQETTLFDATIEDNIKYGNPNATGEVMIKAAKLASIHSRIKRLPEGYQEKVGERGAKLSGGERQRIALARALIRDPTIMLYDEVTSAVDTYLENQIIDSLREVAVNRTTLMVAHRLASVVDMDCIIVLDKGQVVESGLHDDLMTNSSSVYARMWELQRAGVYSDTGRGTRTAPAQIDFIRAIQHPTLPMEAGFVSPEGPIPDEQDRVNTTSREIPGLISH